VAAEIRTPVFVFGMKDDDLQVSATGRRAVEHAQRHAGPGGTLDGYEFFDFDGRPLQPVPGLPGEFEFIDQRQTLENRVRSLITRCDAGLDDPDVPAELRDLLRKFLADKVEFAAVATRLAKLPGTSPKHDRGGLHDLCHRLHLC
jgi:hypothetical protein